MKRVYSSAGHGGSDPGAVDGKGKGDSIVSHEEDINLSVTLFLNDELRRSGLNVKTRRKTDTALEKRKELAARAREANTFEADVAVEVHCDAAGAASARGASVLFKSPEGAELALHVFRELDRVTEWEDRGCKKRDDLYFLNATDMPAVIVELGFITNTEEEERLHDPKYQRALAVAIARGVCRYLRVTYVPAPKPAPAPKASSETPYEWVVIHASRTKAVDLAAKAGSMGCAARRVPTDKKTVRQIDAYARRLEH